MRMKRRYKDLIKVLSSFWLQDLIKDLIKVLTTWECKHDSYPLPGWNQERNAIEASVFYKVINKEEERHNLKDKTSN